ncbi:hypothetical protein [Lentilactobacillus hilgardii]|uniref:hypothetical protein n=1 Tax=Lentilactobacillus hilgardii TaxID=1588 RepID=UPI0021A97689|nr:hypothetical protein [Lentilactobacillus hilgardii]MCT3399369.1 hypothetical protein [Lentilactobacillus hilgardii]
MSLKKCTRFIFLIFATILFGVSVLSPDDANASSTNDIFRSAYNIGRQKHILTNTNMTFKDFKAICKNSLFPSFLKQLKANPETTFQQYIAKDHYEVPIHRVGDHPQTISLKKANVTASQTDNSSTDQSNYQMKPGDILIIYGTSSFKEAKIFGHCAIAISSNDILHMPGMNLGTQQWTKKRFFDYYTGRGSYIEVYRMTSHPEYAKEAAQYAYNDMYKTNSPVYNLEPWLYQKEKSYCSKYVYLAYWFGAAHAALKRFITGFHYIMPHHLIYDFSSGYSPADIYKVTE